MCSINQNTIKEKKVAVIYAYPNGLGFNAVILEVIKENLSSQHHLKVIDLYQENFNPVLYFDETHRRRDLQFDTEIEAYRNIIRWADHLIFVFPIWWGGMPAILKGFIDRVFAKGFAYDYKGILPVGHLKRKSVWIITTHDTPMLYVKLIQNDYGKVLKKQVLKMCGISPVKIYSLPFLRNKKKKGEKFLDKVTRITQKL